jgi:PAS domain S-box-containing protein
MAQTPQLQVAEVADIDEKYRALFDHSLDAIFSLDTQGRFLTANPAGLLMSGYTLEELRERTFPELIVPELLPATMAAFLADLEGEQHKIETAIYRKDGTRVELFVSGIPIRKNDQIVGVFGIAEDITLRKHHEQALQKALDEAKAAAVAKNDFLATVSHELRTPLMPALVTASELQEDTSLSSELRQRIGMIRRNVELEARLIEDLLDYSRMRHGKLSLNLEESDIHEVIFEASAIVTADFPDRSPSITLKAQHHQCRIDAVRMKQVFWNLLKNALKFSSPETAVVVETENHMPGWIRISFNDEGIGIRSEMLERIFLPFEQERTEGPRLAGLGLGLALAKNIVELHGGRITAHSEGLNKGTTFLVELETV